MEHSALALVRRCFNMYRDPVAPIRNTVTELINILAQKGILTQEDIQRLNMASMRPF